MGKLNFEIYRLIAMFTYSPCYFKNHVSYSNVVKEAGRYKVNDNSTTTMVFVNVGFLCTIHIQRQPASSIHFAMHFVNVRRVWSTRFSLTITLYNKHSEINTNFNESAIF